MHYYYWIYHAYIQSCSSPEVAKDVTHLFMGLGHVMIMVYIDASIAMH